MSFRDQTSAFFDELSSIVDEQKKVKEEGMTQGGSPFSSKLTQDEEPTPQYNQSDAEAEPEVVTRRAQ